MQTVLITLILISVLVVVHEGGHYLIAKLCGVRVLEFSIGFGPPLHKWEKNGEIISLRSIPFGGFVKMAGSDPKEHYEKDDFLGKKYYQKVSIVSAGPIFNLIYALFAFFAIYWFVGYPSTKSGRMGKIEKGTIAFESGFKTGDSILSVNNKPFSSWIDFYERLNEKDSNYVEVLRNGHVEQIAFVPDSLTNLGIEPYVPPVIQGLDKSGAAYRYGLREGDTVVKINGINIISFEQMGEIVRKHPDDTLLFTVKRDSVFLNLRVVPEKLAISKNNIIGRIGVVSYSKTVRFSFSKSVMLSFKKSYYVTVMIGKFLYQLISGKTSVKNLGGFIAVGKMVKTSESYGFTFKMLVSNLLNLSAVLSINLFLLNLIPFPALDGFHIFTFSIEALFKKPIKKEIVEWVQIVGFAMLIIFMLMVTFFDIQRIWR